MNQLLIEPAPAHVRRVGDMARIAGIVILVVVLIAIGMVLVRGPDFVARVTVVNTSPYDLDIDVTTGARDGWLPLSVATANTTTSTQEVVDQGDTWIIRFSHEGSTIDEVTTSRAELARNHWRITVPDKVTQQLRAVGEPPDNS
ncbi:MAG TPA: hypothetical protein VEP49_18730 [Acidimicrobiia bacterium]|nr:hypothetical protein [Acidimicrobiia bacterium]